MCSESDSDGGGDSDIEDADGFDDEGGGDDSDDKDYADGDDEAFIKKATVMIIPNLTCCLQ